jgi:hypothetical protein
VQFIKPLRKAKLCAASLYRFAGEEQEGELELQEKKLVFSNDTSIMLNRITNRTRDPIARVTQQALKAAANNGYIGIIC